MARTKQTARKSTGGKAPRKTIQRVSRATKVEIDSYGYDSDLDAESTKSSSNAADQMLMELFALAEDRETVIDDIVEGSASYFFYSALHKVQQLSTVLSNGGAINQEFLETTLEHVSELESFLEYKQEAHALKQQIKLIQLEAIHNETASPDTEEMRKNCFSYWTRELCVKYPGTAHIQSSNDMYGEELVHIDEKTIPDVSTEKLLRDWITAKGAFENTSQFPSCIGIKENILPQLLQYLRSATELEISFSDRLEGIYAIFGCTKTPKTQEVLECIILELQGKVEQMFSFPLSDKEKQEISDSETICFGDREIHNSLSLDNLRLLVDRIPEQVLNNCAFVQQSIDEIFVSSAEILGQCKEWNINSPNDEEIDLATRMCYIQHSLELLNQSTNPKLFEDPDSAIIDVRNDLMFHRLVIDYQIEKIDQTRFIEYLKATKHHESDSKNSDSFLSLLQAQPIQQMQQCQQRQSNRRPVKKMVKINSVRAKSQEIILETSYSFKAYSRDEKKQLIKDYLVHFFSETGSTLQNDESDPQNIIGPFVPYFKKEYLLRLLAKVKLMNLAPCSSIWCKLMGRNSVALGKLTELQILKFAARGNSFSFRPGDDVSIRVVIKNIDRLLLQVYAINVPYYYKQYKSALCLENINLDGLVANYEETLVIDTPAIQQLTKDIPIPMISSSRSGIFVVEIVGGAKACRAIIRKGHLYLAQDVSLDGHLIDVYDIQGNHITGECSITVGEVIYHPKDSKITIPFYDAIEANSDLTENPSCKDSFALVTQSNQKTGIESSFICTITQREKSFVLTAGMFLDNEQLFPGCIANLFIRAKLFLKNKEISLELLRNIVLTITTTFCDGTKAISEVPSLVLSTANETIHSFKVPKNAASIYFEITADATAENKNGSGITARTARFTEVRDSLRVPIGIQTEAQNQIYLPYLRQQGKEYFLWFLGRSGEPCFSIIERKNVSLLHQSFVVDLQLSLPIDSSGCISLGQLQGIQRISVDGYSWRLRNSYFHSFWEPKHSLSYQNSRKSFPAPNFYSSPSTINVLLAEELEIPLPVVCDVKSEILLLRVNSLTKNVMYSCNDAITFDIKRNMMILSLPEAGHFSLQWRDVNVAIKVTKPLITSSKTSETNEIIMNSNHELLECNLRKYLQIESSCFSETGDELIIRLLNCNDNTRVHVIARTFLSSQASIGAALARPPVKKPFTKAFFDVYTSSEYKTTRNISEEYQYILKRRSSQYILPGNFLPSPSLLIHPYEAKKTQNVTSGSSDSSGYSQNARYPRKGTNNTELLVSTNSPDKIDQLARTTYAPFLSSSSKCQENLKPINGEIRVKLDSQWLSMNEFFICAVSNDDVVMSHVHRDQPDPPKFKNLALSDCEAFSEEFHVSEHRGISLLKENETLELNDSEALELKVFDSLRKIFFLLDAKSNYQFLFNEYITEWKFLSQENKEIHYSNDASHEFHLFLYCKDRKFFNSIVIPCISNKKEKQFIDLFLLGEEISVFFALDAFLQLNVIERILLAVRYPDRREDILLHFQDLNGHAQSVSSSQKHSDFVLALASSDSSVSQSIEFRQDSHSRKRSRPQNSYGKGSKRSKGWGMQQNSYEDQEQDDDNDYDDCYEEEDDDSDMDLSENGTGIMLTNRKKKSLVWELQERNYHDGTTGEQKKRGNVSYDSVNMFYIDLMTFLVEKKEKDKEEKKSLNSQLDKPFGSFLSENFMEACSSFTEIMFALSVLDLPFKSTKTQEKLISIDNDRQSITRKVLLKAESPCIVFHTDIRTIKNEQRATDLLVTQAIFDSSGTRNPDEFIAGEIYTCTVSLLNISETTLDLLNVLVQIPVGSIPIGQNSFSTQSRTISIPAHRTVAFSYQFYFQSTGEFRQYPAHVSQGENLVAVADSLKSFKVVSKAKSKIDSLSWDDVSSRGSTEEFLEFLSAPGTKLSKLSFNSNSIASRLADKEVFTSVINLLRKRFVFNADVWKYSLKHEDARSIGEFMIRSPKFLVASQTKAIPFCCPSLGLFPVTNTSNQVEYAPLIHSRVHTTTITNVNLKVSYKSFLQRLIHKAIASTEDLIESVYFLLLQNRIDSAHELFMNRVIANESEVISRIQFDYLSCYFDLYYGESTAFATANEICTKRLSNDSILVPHWKEKFEEVKEVLMSRAKQQEEANNPTLEYAGTSEASDSSLVVPLLEVESIEETEVVLRYQNVTGKVLLNYYLMDVESTFSFEPFADMSSSRCCFIQPSRQQEVDLPQISQNKVQTLPIHLLEEFVNAQVMLEFRVLHCQPSICVTIPHFCSRMSADVSETEGTLILSAKDNKKNRLSSVYVKVFALVGSQSVFYKDGYSDILGFFDYFTISDIISGTVKKFAILLQSDAFGSQILSNVYPPPVRSTGQDARIVRPQ